MSSRRFLIIIVVALGFVALLWGALAYWSTPATDSARPPTARFDMPVASAETPKASNVDYARLDERLQRLMEEPGMVGLAVAVVEDGEIRFIKGYGETFAGGDEPVTPNTVFRWASLSKGVAGDMVALLAEEGRLSLQEPVEYPRHLASPARRQRGGRDRLRPALPPARPVRPRPGRQARGRHGPPLPPRQPRHPAQYLLARHLPRLSERRL